MVSFAIRGGPLAAGLSRHKFLGESVVIKAHYKAVDPAEARRFLHRVIVAERHLTGMALVENKPDV